MIVEIILVHVLMIRLNAFPVCFHNSNNNNCVTIKGYRDSGATVIMLMEGSV